MKVKKIVIVISALLFAVATYHCVVANKPNGILAASGKLNDQSDNLIYDVVPNEATAIKIAEAIWLPRYGTKIYDEKPFKAELKDSSVWIVKGTLPRGLKGGTAYIEIQKRDCKILKVTHYK
jgi:hypothetical protein